MINPEFLDLLKRYGQVTIKYYDTIEESHVGRIEEFITFSVDTPVGAIGSGGYFLDGNEALEDDSLDLAAARLVESVKERARREERERLRAVSTQEDWEVPGSWLSE